MDVGHLVTSLDFTAGLAEHLRGGDVLWAYALLALTTAPPLVPNAVLLVTGGVLAAEGRLDFSLVVAVVAISAVLGDLLIHRTGWVVSDRMLARIHRRPRREALLGWAAERIQRHGAPFVIAVRFLPSGRLVGGLAAGVVRYPARRYLAGAGIAEAVWATYSVGVGYFSGRAASNSLYAVGLGLGVSVFVAGLGSLAHWASRAHERRRPRTFSQARSPLMNAVSRSVPIDGGAASISSDSVPVGGDTVPIGAATMSAQRVGSVDERVCSPAGRAG